MIRLAGKLVSLCAAISLTLVATMALTGTGTYVDLVTPQTILYTAIHLSPIKCDCFALLPRPHLVRPRLAVAPLIVCPSANDEAALCTVTTRRED
ncbi:MAG TPA: hypothetical protein VHZ78_14950 [Rhizomicrobium sp.]|nr:hypothetical protein [Rhizomicrobium sp.]